MSNRQQAKLVEQVLLGAKYRPVSAPLIVGGLDFPGFEAFSGTGKKNDLVLVSSHDSGDALGLVGSVEALGYALDSGGSTRSLTIVLVDSTPSPDVVMALTKVARLIVVPAGSSQIEARRRLSILSPLELPALSQSRWHDDGQSEDVVSEELEANSLAFLLRSLAGGSAKVQSDMRARLELTLRKASS